MVSEQNILKYWQTLGANIEELYKSKDPTDQKAIDFFSKLSEGERIFILHSWQVKHAVQFNLLQRQICNLKRWFFICQAILFLVLFMFCFA